MLVSLKELLKDAETGCYAVVAPDFPNLEVADALIGCAEEYNAPIVLSFSPSLKLFTGLSNFGHFIQIVREMAIHSKVPVALHLDHAHSITEIQEAIQLGFTSVMIDASTEPWDINVERSRMVVEMAHPLGISVEAELGHVASSGQYLSSDSHHGWLTDPQEAADFVEITGIDALAVAIGTVHGLHAGEPNLDFDRLQAIRERVSIPLVLHGSSGTGDEKLRRCVNLGIRKINVYSDLIKTIIQSAKEILARPDDDPLNFMQEQRTAIYRVLGKYMTLSGSTGKADNFRFSIKDRVRSLFLNGHTCAEAIFLTFAEREGFYSETALKIQSLLGGGICNQGGMCGALLGGLAVIAARQSSIVTTERSKRKEANLSGASLIKIFQERYSTLYCIDLTQTNFQDSEQAYRFIESKGIEKTCLPALMSVADWLLENR